MIAIISPKKLNYKEKDKEFWSPVANAINACIPGVLVCQFVLIASQSLRLDFSFLENKLYFYSLISFTFLYVILKLALYVKEKINDYRNKKVSENKNKIKEKNDAKYWRELLKPLIIYLPGFIVGQFLSICLDMIERNFSFFKDYIHQAFVGILLLVALSYGIFHYITTKNERSHKTFKEKGNDFVKDALNFALISVPGAIAGLLFKFLKLDFSFIHNTSQQIFIGILLLAYIALKIVQYVDFKKNEITPKKITKTISNLSSYKFEPHHFSEIINNKEFIENLHLIYEIIHIKNPEEVEKIDKNSNLTIEDFYVMLRVIGNYNDIKVELNNQYFKQIKVNGKNPSITNEINNNISLNTIISFVISNTHKNIEHNTNKERGVLQKLFSIQYPKEILEMDDPSKLTNNRLNN